MASEHDEGGLWLLHVFATFDAGGPQVRTVELMRRISREHMHAVVAADGRTGAASRLPASVPVSVLSRPASAWRQLRDLRRIVRAAAPDLVLTYNWGAILGCAAARAEGVPCVHHEEVVPVEETGSGLLRRDLLRRAVLRSCSAVVVPSRGLAQRAIGRWGLNPSRVQRIDNGVELDARQARIHRSTSDGPLVVGTVAHARPEKNWPRLLRTFASLSAQHVVLRLAGDGPERARSIAITQQLGIADRVQMLGALDDTRTCYEAMDVFVLASDDEQMPLAVLEAMAHGLPVVATDVGEVRAMLPDEQHRFVVPVGPGAEVAMASALDELLSDEALRARLGAANRARAERHFDLRHVAQRYEDLYRVHARPRTPAEACA